MTDHGDDADDDPQLKSLRAVWLSMPDEEPPARGLAELMAAARVKAEEMAKPSLWQRISALLRRPAVLALATVLVLIGGAVFIGQRRHEMSSEPTVASEPTSGSAAVVEAPRAPAAEEQKAEEREPELAEPALEATIPPKQDPATQRPSRPSRRPAGQSVSEPQNQKKSEAVHATAESNGVLRGGESEGRMREDKQAISGDRFAAPEKATTKSSVQFSQDDEPRAGATAQPGADSAATTTTAPPPPAPASRAAQYLAQARSAAARGDCAAARTMMKRVATEDAATYKKALASDASLKKCVVTAAE